jgi:hypothetical protein
VRINNYLGDKVKTVSCIKPGALIEELLDKLRMNLMNLTKCNVIVHKPEPDVSLSISVPPGISGPR